MNVNKALSARRTNTVACGRPPYSAGAPASAGRSRRPGGTVRYGPALRCASDAAEVGRTVAATQLLPRFTRRPVARAGLLLTW